MWIGMPLAHLALTISRDETCETYYSRTSTYPLSPIAQTFAGATPLGPTAVSENAFPQHLYSDTEPDVEDSGIGGGKKSMQISIFQG